MRAPAAGLNLDHAKIPEIQKAVRSGAAVVRCRRRCPTPSPRCFGPSAPRARPAPLPPAIPEPPLFPPAIPPAQVYAALQPLVVPSAPIPLSAFTQKACDVLLPRLERAQELSPHEFKSQWGR